MIQYNNKWFTVLAIAFVLFLFIQERKKDISNTNFNTQQQNVALDTTLSKYTINISDNPSWYEKIFLKIVGINLPSDIPKCINGEVVSVIYTDPNGAETKQNLTVGDQNQFIPNEITSALVGMKKGEKKVFIINSQIHSIIVK